MNEDDRWYRSLQAIHNATVAGGIHACRLEVDAPDFIFTKTSSKEFSYHILVRGEWIGTNGILILVTHYPLPCPERESSRRLRSRRLRGSDIKEGTRHADSFFPGPRPAKGNRPTSTAACLDPDIVFANRIHTHDCLIYTLISDLYARAQLSGNTEIRAVERGIEACFLA